MEEESDVDEVHEEGFGKGKCSAHQASHAPAQRGVEAFEMVCVLLLSLLVELVGRDGVGVSGQTIGKTAAVLVLGWHFGPDILSGESVPLAPHPCHNLTGAAAQHKPQPDAVLLVAHKRPHLIQLQHIVLLSGHKRLFQGALRRQGTTQITIFF